MSKFYSKRVNKLVAVTLFALLFVVEFASSEEIIAPVEIDFAGPVTTDDKSDVPNDSESSTSMDDASTTHKMRPPHPSKYTEEASTAFKTRDFAKRDRTTLKASAQNIRNSENFMTQYRQKSGVVQLPDGLMYRVIKSGSGPKPKESDNVSCIFRGRLADDTEFETSSNKPAVVHLESLVKGLREALLSMSVGSKIEAVIPSSIGFGMKGKPPKVGPNALTIYDLELLAIVPQTPTKP